MDLAARLGSDFSDGAADTVTVVGTAGKDTIAATDNGGARRCRRPRRLASASHTRTPRSTRSPSTPAPATTQVSIDPAAAQLIQVSVQ